jgi:hypothetical protein
VAATGVFLWHPVASASKANIPARPTHSNPELRPMRIIVIELEVVVDGHVSAENSLLTR